MIDQSEPRCFRSTNHIACKNQFTRALLTYDQRQKHASDRRKHAEFYLWLSKPRAIAGDDDIASGHELASPTKRRSVDDGDRWFSQLLQAAKNRMKRLKHLKDRFGDMLFDSNAGAECMRLGHRIENNRYQFALGHTFFECLGDLLHHGDVEDIQRQARQCDARDAIFNIESDVFKCVHVFVVSQTLVSIPWFGLTSTFLIAVRQAKSSVGPSQGVTVALPLPNIRCTETQPP